MTDKKICFFMPRAFDVITHKKSGGAELNVFFLANNLKKILNAEHVFLTGINGKNSKIKYQNVNFKGIKFLEKKNNLFFYKILARLFFLIEIFKSQADIYFFSGASEFFGLAVILLKIFRKQSKIIYRCASDSDLNLTFLLKNPVIYFLTFTGIKFADYIILQNNLQKNLINKFQNKNFDIIKGGMFEIKKKIDFSERKYFLYVGKYSKIKNPDLFIEIAKKFPEKKFLAIITGEGKLKKSILKKTRILKNLKILDYVPWNDIDGFYKSAIALINTSDYEGFPNTFIQAFIYSTPVISLNVNPDNILSKYKTGYYAGSSLENIFIFLKKSDNNTYKELGENCYRYVLKYHTTKRLEKSYKKIFNKVI